MSLQEALGGHRNALGLLRLLFAAAVIVDHAFPLGGWGTAPFLRYTSNQQSLGGLAVVGFFAISGYLIARSGMTSDVLQFMWRRFLRIFPGFWLVLLVGAFLVGPAIWVAEGNDLGDYFTLAPGGPVAYLYSNWTLTIGQWGIHDIYLETTPYWGGAINGSIWTLVYEWGCYLVIAVLVGFGVLKKAKIVVPLIAAFFFVAQVAALLLEPGALAPLFPTFGDPWRINFGLVFFIGATVAMYADRIPFDDRLGVLSGIAAVGLLRVGGFNTVGYVAFTYFVLYLAARLPRALQRVGAKNDYSYGVYLYGWVVQQVLSFLGVNGWGYVPYVAIALVTAFGLAWLSWHGVEKQTLKLKNWGPGRGLRYWGDRARSVTSRKKVPDGPRPVLAPVGMEPEAADDETEAVSGDERSTG
jgi:peptidoglycan/LPS O-acetylase OafA/YrhL